LFPGKEVLLDYIHNDLKFSGTQRNMELDIFIPSLSLALEYQGRQHYKDIGMKILSVQHQLRRDMEKKAICKQKGITLVQVPYWWDGKDSTIAATIHQYPIKIIVEVAYCRDIAEICLETPKVYQYLLNIQV
jgi:hypothetical protein